ncbi:MAG: hypothetical protein ACRET5_03075, partial [Steroidobacteraceae bacterium]
MNEMFGVIAAACARRIPLAFLVACCTCALGHAVAHAQSSGPTLRPDPRIRVVPYRADAVYRLRGYVGYQIDITFAPDERFVGLGVGD